MKSILFVATLMCGLWTSALAQGVQPVKVGRYTLESNPWVNLHQRLLYEAKFNSAPPATLTSDDLKKWNSGVEVYRKWLGNRSPIVDPELTKLNDTLAKA